MLWEVYERPPLPQRGGGAPPGPGAVRAGRTGPEVRGEDAIQVSQIWGFVMQLSHEYVGRNVRPETLGETGELFEAHIRAD